MDLPITYYKVTVNLVTGKRISGIRHFQTSDINALKERLTTEARNHYKEQFHYLDLWTMHSQFTEVIDYKKEKGLE